VLIFKAKCMSYFKMDKLSPSEKKRLLREFNALIGKIKNQDEASLILTALLTSHERGNLMRRVDVAILLLAGCTHNDIQDLLNVGKTKIRNVEKKLMNPRTRRGYDLILEKVISVRKKQDVKIRRIELQEARKGERPDLEMFKQKYKGVSMGLEIIDKISDSLIIKKEEKGVDMNEKIKSDYKKFRQQ